MRAIILVALLLVGAVCGVGWAQTEAPPAGDPTSAAAVAAEEGPVPVPEPSEKAMQWYHSGNKLWLFGLVWDLALPAVILFTGFSAWLRDRARGSGRPWPVTVGLYWIFFNVAVAIIEFPLNYYRGFVRPHAYGVTEQLFSKFLQDSVISLALGCVIGALLIWIPYLLLRRSPKRWWIYVSIIAVPFMIVSMLVQPMYIDPLFNKFGAMQDKALEAKILAIAERAGIAGGRVYEVEKSVDTKMVNAYVTGFGGSKRIVLWDTLLQKLDEREALFVMAHEMGHYVLGHVAKSIAFFTVLLTIALYAVHRFSGALISRYSGRFGFTELSDPAALPLVMLIVGVLSLVLMPVAMGYSRMNEHESDRFALEITRDNHAGASAFVKLQQENLGNPRPDWFVKVWRGSHPTLGDRIDFCNSYHPWKDGQAGAYEHLFKEAK